ncbi:MAG: ATP-dependent helicase HrpA [Alphaproteobacteria bacterium]|jgi:ATP-dependent helicase HrpA
MTNPNTLSKELDKCKLQDQFALRRRWSSIQTIKDSEKRDLAILGWQDRLKDAQHKLTLRSNVNVSIEYPSLPVSDKKEDIKALIEKHQVVIIAGETGSGKTTQLPKMCLELGRGRKGMIGHTQPRRLAARSVASRIAEELKTTVGQVVGCKVRFSDQVSDVSLIKLLTDGMLLAEMQQDKLLSQYDTIIIDEAHERSLNIDFLLGYLKRILPKRPDLKIIITSATIDPQRFSEHFNGAPIIEVSGRSFAVDIQYRDYVEQRQAQDQIEAISLAVEELFAYGRGDILVFLSSEREIRETQQALQKKQYTHTEVIPLYARLSASDQQKIFHPQGRRRIVLSTNVAETSLTVPGIKYVIDSGLVRMSRYSHRLKVQRLPIEAISQASAKQRAGRCGRTSQGICIRLYSEQDFLSRPEFTDPEITRTHLSSVILQMLNLGLGEIKQFEFIQPPQEKFITDGVRLLQELQAVDIKAGRLHLNDLGRKMARFPLDPKYARMLLAAGETDCVSEVMAITAGLSVQDPRERPHDKQQKADLAHGEFADKDSDLISLLNLYQSFKAQQKELTQNQLRKWCLHHFVHYQRMREWQDITHQVKHMLVSVGLRLNSEEADYQKIHTAMAIGLLSQLGLKDLNHEYLGARNSKFKIFPGSALFKTQPKWIMAAELVETTTLYARQVAKVDTQWIEPIAQHLLKKSYVEAHWSKKRGSVMAYMNALLFGLPIVSRRLINYSTIDHVHTRDLFIRHALVQGETKLDYAFLRSNQALVEDIQLLEKKTRRRDILADEEDLVAFYDARVDEYVCSEQRFIKWWRKASQKTPDLLNFEKHELLKRDASDITEAAFPDTWHQGSLVLPLEYQFEPNKEVDGIILVIPIELLNQVKNIGFDWLVPGLRHELLVALIKSLPKRLRRNFVPAPDYANACLHELQATDKLGNILSITQAFALKLFRMSGIQLSSEDFTTEGLDGHLTINFKVVDNKGQQVAVNKSLPALKQQLHQQLKQTIDKVVSSDIEKQDINSFEIEALPKVYTQSQSGFEVKAYPALSAIGKRVDIKLFTSLQEAEYAHKLGLIRLIKNNVPSPMKYLQEKLPNKAKLSLYFNPFGQIQKLIDDIIDASVDELLQAFGGASNIRSQQDYKKALELVRMELNAKALEIAKQVEMGLAIANQVQKHCKGSIPLTLVAHVGHIKKHLSELVYKGFVFDCGLAKLPDWNRYLKGLLQRCDKLKVDASRDRLHQLEVDKAQNLYAQTQAQLDKQMRKSNELPLVKEMIDEFRISLYAQQLGTKYPISLKRISIKLQDIAINS